MEQEKWRNKKRGKPNESASIPIVKLCLSKC